MAPAESSEAALPCAPGRDGVHELAVMRGHNAPVCALATPASQPGAPPALPLLYSASWDGAVRVWWSPSHSPLAVLEQKAPPCWPLPPALPQPKATEVGRPEPRGEKDLEAASSATAASGAEALGAAAAMARVASPAMGGGPRGLPQGSASIHVSPIRALALAYIPVGGRTAAPECVGFCGTDSGHIWVRRWKRLTESRVKGSEFWA